MQTITLFFCNSEKGTYSSSSLSTNYSVNAFYNVTSSRMPTDLVIHLIHHKNRSIFFITHFGSHTRRSAQ